MTPRALLERVAAVPVEPTPEMLAACDTIIQGYGAKLVWARMLAAAPAIVAQPSGEVDSEPLAGRSRMPGDSRWVLTEHEPTVPGIAKFPLFYRSTPLAAPVAPSAVGDGELPVAWARTEFIRDEDGRPIGTDEPRVVWGSEHPDPDESWWPLFDRRAGGK